MTIEAKKESPSKRPRERTKIRPAQERLKDFNPGDLGFDEETALREAERCLLCKKPLCQLNGCPLSNRIPEWIACVRDKKYEEAASIIWTQSPFPEICSRVCPQERLCEKTCVVGVKNEPIAIGALERFVMDEVSKKRTLLPERPAPTGFRVAVIGSGPAGLAAADRLVRKGHEVVVYDQGAVPGGLLVYGIPPFKLDRKVVDHVIQKLKDLGVTFCCGVRVSQPQTLREEGFHAVLVATGASTPILPSLPGVYTPGVVSALTFLQYAFVAESQRTAFLSSPKPIKESVVAIFGGGDSAMDCARSALRLGAKTSMVVYRRDEPNMPGSKKERKAAVEEGVKFEYLVSPVRIEKGEGASALRVWCERMQLTEPKPGERAKPVRIPNSEFPIEVDLAILAFGFEVNRIPEEETKESGNGQAYASPETGATKIRGVFAAGDCVNGADLVATAIVSAQKASKGVEEYLATMHQPKK